MIMRTCGLVLAAAFAVFGTAAVSASPGPLDANGCHFSETQGYHCHR